MPSIRIWTLESDYDAKVVECLASKLATHLHLGNLSIQTSGKGDIPKRDTLTRAVQNHLREDICVIFVIDRDGPMSIHQRRQEPNSLINQVSRIVDDRRFADRVFLVEAVHELEAWLLIDCLGVFCYFSSKSPRHRRISRSRILANPSFARLVSRYQRGNTERIVETQSGGRGAKEYLVEFSGQILRRLNSNMPQRNLRRQRYREAMAPDIVEYVVINRETLRRNDSLSKLGDLLARFK